MDITFWKIFSVVTLSGIQFYYLQNKISYYIHI